MRRLPLLIAAAVLLAGCNRAESVRAPSRSVVITLGDYRQTPQKLEVRPGVTMFTVRNEGRQPHNFQLRGRGAKRGRVPTLLPGESGTMTVRLRRGDYVMYCGIGHHEELGEYGLLSVRRR